MLNKIIKITLIAAFILASSANASSKMEDIKDDGKLVLGTSGNMTPMTRSINGGKSAVGLDIDLAQTMADTMGVELEIKIYPLDKLIEALKDGDVDIVISNLTITPKRNMEVAFVGPYLRSGKCLITKQPDLASAQKEELNNANNKMVVIKGSTSQMFVEKGMPKVTAVAVESQEDAIQMVRESKVAAMLTDYPICAAVVLNNPDDHFASVFSNLTFEPIGIAINPENTHLINWTQNFLFRADNVGLFKALSKKWLGR